MAEFSGPLFAKHYAGHHVMSEVTSLTIRAATQPQEYRSHQLRGTVLQLLDHLSSNFCSEDWEGSTAIAEAQTMDDSTAYGSFFASSQRSGFCLLHGSGHVTSSCKQLKQLQRKFAQEWDPSENGALRADLWKLSICNPFSLQRQATARQAQRGHEAQLRYSQGAAADPVTPGKRAGMPLNQALAKRLLPTATPAVAAAALPAATSFAGGLFPPQQPQQPFNNSIAVATAAVAAPTPAPAAADLLSFVVKHTTEEGRRTSMQLEEMLKLVAELQAQNAALNSVRAELETRLRKQKSELGVYRTRCKCCAREKAAAVRDAADA
ncbi:hypothetical protein COO60DRAFT_1655395 [Scenedesmus sp. NREL 46B-D3]|nr:hypothetical protein COO60DRAFT_1655395 [Scenedesmus sp. NREL 46B-D3]